MRHACPANFSDLDLREVTPCAYSQSTDERGMDRQQLYTRGYWKLGAADHPDHDTGED